MKKIRTLFVQFEQEIPFHKLSAFRGGVVEKVGRQHQLFHQHQTDGKLIYRYPIIQYKRNQKKAAILCLGEGVDEIHKLFGLNTWEIDLKGEPVQLTVDRLDLNSFTFQVWDKKIPYQLHNWIGLNAKNYEAYQKASGLKEQLEILERVLTGNILSMAKGLGWEIDKQVEASIQEINQTKPIRHKGIQLMSFNLTFETNVALPNYIGIGKSVSHGFGIIKKKNK